MTITKAIDRVFWRLKSIRTNEIDQEAVEVITNFVNDKHRKQIQDYELFAKLYIMVYAQFLEKYNSTVFDDLPRKELNKMLSKPIEVFIERFKNKMNETDLYKRFTDVGISLKHPATLSDGEREKETQILQENDIDIQDCWDYETVKIQLENLINLSINELK